MNNLLKVCPEEGPLITGYIYENSLVHSPQERVEHEFDMADLFFAITEKYNFSN